VSGRDITLKYAGENLTIKIDENAQISSYTTSSKGAVQAKAELKDIRIGDNLSINLRLLPDSTLKGMSIVIIRTE
jgi:hypothetical protein